MTAFYIAYYESYDVSDGTEIIHLASGPMSDIDEFEGHAVNADMPFKSIYISHMSDYLNEDVYLAQWLTLQDIPYAIVGYFFDISFINSIPDANILVNIDKQNNGVVIETTTLDAELDAVLGGSDPETATFSGVNPGVGIIRVPITAESGFDQYCIYAYTESHMEDVEVPPPPFNLADFLDSGSGDPWNLGATPFILNTHDSGVLYISYATTLGTPYRFNYRFQVDNVAPGTKIIHIATLDAGIGGISFEPIVITVNGIYEGFVGITPSANGLYFGLNNAASVVPFDLYVLE